MIDLILSRYFPGHSWYHLVFLAQTAEKGADQGSCKSGHLAPNGADCGLVFDLC
jgi:hypothetical protein